MRSKPLLTTAAAVLSLLAAPWALAQEDAEDDPLPGFQVGRFGGVRPARINPVLQDHGVPMVQKRLTPDEYAAWFTEPLLIDHAEASLQAGAITPPAAPDARYATGAQGDIFVVEGNNQLVLHINQQGRACTPGSSGCFPILNHQGGAAQYLAQILRQELGDQYDMVVVWTTFEDYAAAAYYAPLRNDIEGLGVCNPNSEGQDGLFGCVYDQTEGWYLQGGIFMNSIDMWLQVDQQWRLSYGELDVRSQLYATLGQESAHRWLAGFHARNPTDGRRSNWLLGRDKSHWNLKLSAQASWMDGLAWQDNGNGSFTITGDNDGYSDLDLYGMGLLAPSEVQPFFFVQDAASTRLQSLYRQFGFSIPTALPDGTEELPAGFPPIDAIGPMAATGTRVDLTIDDILVACGERVPSVANSPKTFKQAWVLVTLPTESGADAVPYVNRLDAVRRQWEQHFSTVTRGLGTVCTSLSGVCVPASAEINTLRYSDASGDNNGEWSRGETADFFLVLGNSGGARIDNVTADLSSGTGGVVVEQGTVQVSGIPGGGVVEAPQAFRVRADNVDCGTSSVSLTVTLQGGDTPRSQEFTYALKPCADDGSGGDTGLLPGPGVDTALPGPCACALPSAGSPLAGMAVLAAAWLMFLRRRR